MAVKLKHTLTGGVVEVSEDAVDRFRGFGFEPVEAEKPAAEKPAPKRAARKSTSTSEADSTE